MKLWTLFGAFLIASLILLPSAAVSHYTPRQGDFLNYYETITVNNGQGNYTGYVEHQYINGTERITSLQPGGVAGAFYQYFWSYSNNTGASISGSSAGNYTFSYDTYHYVNGTDGQAGYSNPFVWFYMNNTLGQSSQFYLLNTQMVVSSTDYSYHLLSEGKYVRAIYAQGAGSYQRNDAYGLFTATYTWNTYFDPGTGYIIGYQWTEHDSDSAGNGFTYTEVLYVTSTSFALTAASAPTAQPQGFNTTDVLLLVAVLAIVIIIVTAVVLRSRSRRARGQIPQHPSGGKVGYNYASKPPEQLERPEPHHPPPPPINLTPQQQPPVQQIVVEEVVKVKCQFCGTLIDSTALRCPVCGAPRS